MRMDLSCASSRFCSASFLHKKEWQSWKLRIVLLNTVCKGENRWLDQWMGTSLKAQGLSPLLLGCDTKPVALRCWWLPCALTLHFWDLAQSLLRLLKELGNEAPFSASCVAPWKQSLQLWASCSDAGPTAPKLCALLTLSFPCTANIQLHIKWLKRPFPEDLSSLSPTSYNILHCCRLSGVIFPSGTFLPAHIHPPPSSFTSISLCVLLFLVPFFSS